MRLAAAKIRIILFSPGSCRYNDIAVTDDKE